ncbi:MAG TPA: rhodanese-like domain-containing protein [Steroidobacteraceae bacterium]|nr:rhodanese-like domain-containing protein [Steroidobacteraceae bacterium]
MVREYAPAEVAAQLKAPSPPLLLDVREAWELEIARLPEALHIPMAQVPARLSELDRRRDVVVMCRSGGRSLNVARFLDAQGFPSVANLTGGILAWRRDVDPALATY